MSAWKDVTSYSRGDAARVPRSWEQRSGELRVLVHRHIHYGNDTWLLSCHAVGIDTMRLSAHAVDLAQSDAIRIVRERVDALAAYAAALTSEQPPAGPSASASLAGHEQDKDKEET